MFEIRGVAEIGFRRPGSKERHATALASKDFATTVGADVLNCDSLGIQLENYFEFLRVIRVAGSEESAFSLEIGDLVVRINDQPVSAILDIENQLSDVSTITVRRRSQKITMSKEGAEFESPSFNLQVINYSESPVQLHWKDPETGQEELYQSVPPRQAIQQSTTDGHMWVLRYAASGDLVNEFTSTSSAKLVYIPPSEGELSVDDAGSKAISTANGNLVLTQVAYGSKSEQWGLEVGDRIKSVDRQEIKSLNDRRPSLESCSNLEVLPYGQVLAVELQAVPGEENSPNMPVEGDSKVELPDWVMNSESNVPGGISVIEPSVDQLPPAANLVTFYVAEKAGPYVRLKRVRYYGKQVVAGVNHYFVCEMEDRMSNKSSTWHVQIYVDLDNNSKPKIVEQLK